MEHQSNSFHRIRTNSKDVAVSECVRQFELPRQFPSTVNELRTMKSKNNLSPMQFKKPSNLTTSNNIKVSDVQTLKPLHHHHQPPFQKVKLKLPNGQELGEVKMILSSNIQFSSKKSVTVNRNLKPTVLKSHNKPRIKSITKLVDKIDTRNIQVQPQTKLKEKQLLFNNLQPTSNLNCNNQLKNQLILGVKRNSQEPQIIYSEMIPAAKLQKISTKDIGEFSFENQLDQPERQKLSQNMSIKAMKVENHTIRDCNTIIDYQKSLDQFKKQKLNKNVSTKQIKLENFTNSNCSKFITPISKGVNTTKFKTQTNQKIIVVKPGDVISGSFRIAERTSHKSVEINSKPTVEPIVKPTTEIAIKSRKLLINSTAISSKDLMEKLTCIENLNSQNKERVENDKMNVQENQNIIETEHEVQTESEEEDSDEEVSKLCEKIESFVNLKHSCTFINEPISTLNFNNNSDKNPDTDNQGDEIGKKVEDSLQNIFKTNRTYNEVNKIFSRAKKSDLYQISEILQSDFKSNISFNSCGLLGIHDAVIRNNLLQVKQHIATLKMMGKSIDVSTQDEKTSLEIAIEYDINPKIIKVLLKAGAQPVQSKPSHDSAMIIAAKNSSKNLPILCKYIDQNNKTGVNLKGKEGLAAIHYCAIHGNLQGITELLKCGADVNLQDDRSGRTALFYAMETRNSNKIQDIYFDIAFKLLEHGAISNIHTFSKHSVLNLIEDIKSFKLKMAINRAVL
ncbi:uncharacterized protein LOC106659353 [Trichogramma pretiosum]|uniref:uncharacterized protein LOC106659353 n=1 Tax=Trichogramma pretiosum TaxID=7493 RepID=UPI0006C953F1|nr:uncharacterized protein LOC106659353 [Trichogramma pretiosum]